MIETTDQMGNTIILNNIPQRIVSVVPSQTELLYDLGLENSIVGITKFCIHPEKIYSTKTKVGGTKKLHIDQILLLNPDIIIANKEENDRQQIEQLQQHFPVWISDIYNLDDSLNMMLELGKLFNKDLIAHKMSDEIKYSFSKLQCIKKRKKVCYLIWNNPIMVAGRNTFINDMLNRCGFENCIEETDSRYPELTIEQLVKLNPDYVFLSSEPFPFKKKHVDYINSVLPNAKSILVNGELFSWYGSRLLSATNYFKFLIEKINSF